MRRSLALVGVMSAMSFAYPIPQQSLWSLTNDAPIIVAARISANNAHPLAAEERNDTTAVLEVTRVLKGSAEKTIEWPLSQSSVQHVCPVTHIVKSVSAS